MGFLATMTTVLVSDSVLVLSGGLRELRRKLATCAASMAREREVLRSSKASRRSATLEAAL